MNFEYPNIAEVVFLSPLWLWGLVLPALLLFFGFVIRRQHPLALLGRALVLALLFVALAEPAHQEERSSQELSVLIDLSQSVPKEAGAAFRELLEPYLKQPDSRLRTFFFGRELASTERVFRSVSELAELEDIVRAQSDVVDAGATNIQAALEGVSERSAAASLLLISDGQETDGQSAVAADAARAQGLRIFPLTPEEDLFVEQALTLSQLEAPLTVAAGDSAEVRATVKNTAKSGTQAAVMEIWLEQKKLLSQQISVPAQEERTLSVKTGAIEGGLHRIRVKARPINAAKSRESELHRWIAAKERSRILLLSGSTEDQKVLKQLFSLRGYTLEDIVVDGSQKVPTNFDSFPTVILNNVGAPQLPGGFLPSLKSYVQGGGRLLIIGGDQSYGLGRYIDTPLEEISPLKFVPPRTTKRRLNTAVVLVIDKSRSMLEDNKIESAKRAALLSINALKQDDFIGVIGFDSAPFVIIRLAPVPEVQPVAERRLRNLTAAGRTNMLAAVAAARQSLSGSQASRKHVIVLSDGQIADAGQEYFSELSRMQADNITLSAVALGADADIPFLKTLAGKGKGAFYHTIDPTRLPEIFVNDIRVTTGEKTMRERQEFLITPGPAGLISARPADFPVLRGFVETLPKSGSKIELVTSDDKGTHPILASWNYEKGKVVAFTSDANGRWSLPWLSWSGFSRFWSDIIENLKTGPDTKKPDLDFDLRYRIVDQSLELDLTVFDSELGERPAPAVSAQVTAPGGASRVISFASEAKGRFLSRIEQARPGDYRISVSYGDAKLPPIGVTLSADRFGERFGGGIRYDVLAGLASRTEGKLNPAPADLQQEALRSKTFTPLHVYPLLLAFICAICTIFIREKLESN